LRCRRGRCRRSGRLRIASYEKENEKNSAGENLRSHDSSNATLQRGHGNPHGHVLILDPLHLSGVQQSEKGRREASFTVDRLPSTN
jgi:hypothetical protein